MLNLVLLFNLCNVGYKHCFLLKIWWFIIHYYGLLDNQSRSLPIKKKKSHINVSDYYFCANAALPEFPWHVNQQARRVTEVIRFFSKSTLKTIYLQLKKCICLIYQLYWPLKPVWGSSRVKRHLQSIWTIVQIAACILLIHLYICISTSSECPIAYTGTRFRPFSQLLVTIDK